VGTGLAGSKWHIRNVWGLKWLRKKTKRVEDAVDWADYFDSIRNVCPWSAPAYQKGKIQIKIWKGKPEELEENLAVVYVHKYASARLLKKIMIRMNSARPAEEWLYSHPKFKGHSTEVPVLIQQDLAHLSRARQKGEK
jgi:hypothetical protein